MGRLSGPDSSGWRVASDLFQGQPRSTELVATPWAARINIRTAWALMTGQVVRDGPSRAGRAARVTHMRRRQVSILRPSSGTITKRGNSHTATRSAVDVPAWRR